MATQENSFARASLYRDPDGLLQFFRFTLHSRFYLGLSLVMCKSQSRTDILKYGSLYSSRRGVEESIIREWIFVENIKGMALFGRTIPG